MPAFKTLTEGFFGVGSMAFRAVVSMGNHHFLFSNWPVTEQTLAFYSKKTTGDRNGAIAFLQNEATWD